MKRNIGFRPEKAVEVILYVISSGCDNLYNILKVIYFADKMRLSLVASTMFKDSYIAIQAGPVPSGAYDLLKDARDQRKPTFNVGLPFVFDSEDSNVVNALRAPNMRYLSKVDIRCLNKSIEKYGLMDYWSLRNISHEQSDYQAVGLKDWIPLDVLVNSVDHDGNIKSFLSDVRNDECCVKG